MPEDPDLPQVLGAEFIARPHPILRRLRRTGSVTKVRTPSGAEVWVVTRARDVRAGLADPRLVTAATSTYPEPGAGALQVSLLDYAPADHARLRRLAASCFTPARAQAHRPAIEAIAEDLVTRLATTARADLLTEFAYPLAGRVTATVFGLAGPSTYAAVVMLAAKPRRSPEDRRRAVAAIEAAIEAAVQDRIGHLRNGDDVFSAIVGAWRASADPVTREELLSLCGMLVLAGFETTAQMLCLAVLAVLTRPELARRLRDDPGAVPGAVEELLRWDAPGPFTTRRHATEDIELGGSVIPAGSTVLLSIMAANRDPDAHPAPDVLDLERRERHLAFGLGPHFCLGAPLARLSLTVALTTLLRGCPDLALAVPPTRLRWAGSHLNRGLAALPVFPSGPG